jgi:hypothetical protein
LSVTCQAIIRSPMTNPAGFDTATSPVMIDADDEERTVTGNGPASSVA